MEWPDGLREDVERGDDESTGPVVIDRMDGGPRLVIEQPSHLAYDFFSRDASSVGPNAYDGQVGRGEPNRITIGDIVAINTTMRARSRHTAWASLTDAAEPLPWLAEIPARFALFSATDGEWAAMKSSVEAALKATIGPYRNLSVATKVLHLKRPELFPVLDSLVIQQLGGYGRAPIELMAHMRHVGRENYLVLGGIAATLEKMHIQRTPVRILDSLLWTSHPASSLGLKATDWQRVIRPTS